MNKKYLMFVDILGFRKLAAQMSERSGFQEDIIREKFLSDPLQKKIEKVERYLLKRKIEELERKGVQQTKERYVRGSDNYVLMIDDIRTAFETIGELTTIKIPHRDYIYVPLEIGLDIQEIEGDIDVDIINRKEIIDFLKDNIIDAYCDYYKEKHQHSIKETFLLFTERIFDDLEQLNKKYCEKVSHKGKTFFVVNIQKIQQRCRVFNFLKEIECPNRELYERIDEIYAFPVEYEEIGKALRERKIVFITGTQEYGKTYTAVRLMWEYYNEGYEPRWIKGGEERERSEVREKLENIEYKPRQITYFEDPFGKLKYEKREGLERGISTIIDLINQGEDFYLIITSREECFKEFGNRAILRNIRQFEIRMNLKTPSYDYEKRKEILEKWAEEEDCKWLKDDRLKDSIMRSIGGEKNLFTPLSIRNFAIATVNIDTVSQLEEKIKEKSEQTVIAFSREIKNMSDDKILFLLFLGVSSHFEVNFARETYEKLIKELNLTGSNVWDFDRVLNWFKYDKIDADEYMEFSHPSYAEALEHLLFENGYTTRIYKDIFSKLLLRLSESDWTAGDVASAIAENFVKSPRDEKDLLDNLANNDKISADVASTVAENFVKFPNKAEELLFDLAERIGTAEDVAWAVAENFDALPDDTRNKLLMYLAEKDEAVRDVARAVAYGFNTLPIKVRSLLDELQNPLQQVIRDLSMSSHVSDKEEALDLIFNAWSKIDLDLISRILRRLSRCEDKIVKLKAKKLLKMTFNDLKENRKD